MKLIGVMSLALALLVPSLAFAETPGTGKAHAGATKHASHQTKGAKAAKSSGVKAPKAAKVKAPKAAKVKAPKAAKKAPRASKKAAIK